MTRSTLNVTISRAQDLELPSYLNRGVLMLLRLRDQGVLDEVGQRLRIHRQGGYNGLHLFIVAVLLLMSGTGDGLQTFRDRLGGHATRIAALFGLRSLPSASAMSRLLASLTPEVVASFCPWLLRADGGRALLASTAVTSRDGLGNSWHVVDYDPTVETLLRRPLAHPADAPTPTRRSQDLATPGYTGRKRGDVRLRRFALGHAGSGLWRFVDMDNGQGDGRDPLRRALEAMTGAVQEASPEAQVVVRMDGEFGHVPALKIAEKAGIHPLCRLPRYQLLERQDVQQRLNEAPWWPVDNCSGFQRHAAEIGWLNLYASERTPQSEEEADLPVTVRVIAVRSPCSGEAGRGVKIGDEQIELFATTVDEGSWPTAEVIELYQGRSALENRFAQEDRAFGLDRIFSYNLPGQLWMTALGMFLWNCEIVAGVELHPLPDSIEIPSAARQRAQPKRLPVLFPSCVPDAAVAQVERAISVSALSTESSGPQAPPPPFPAPDEQALIDELESALDAAHWSSLPTAWRRDRGTLTLTCSQRLPLKLYFVEHASLPGKGKKPRQNRVGYRTQVGACDGCPLYQACRGEASPHTYRFLNKTLPYDDARRAYELLTALRRRIPYAPNRYRQRITNESPSSSKTRPAPTPLFAQKPPFQQGDRAIQPALFSPASARNAFAEHARHVHLRVHINPGRANDEDQSHPLLRRPRQHAMPAVQSWKTRLARYDLPPHIVVTLYVATDQDRAAGRRSFRGATSTRLAS